LPVYDGLRAAGSVLEDGHVVEVGIGGQLPNERRLAIADARAQAGDARGWRRIDDPVIGDGAADISGGVNGLDVEGVTAVVETFVHLRRATGLIRPAVERAAERDVALMAREGERRRAACRRTGRSAADVQVGSNRVHGP
jgi:hypothetical protein